MLLVYKKFDSMTSFENNILVFYEIVQIPFVL